MANTERTLSRGAWVQVRPVINLFIAVCIENVVSSILIAALPSEDEDNVWAIIGNIFPC